VNALIDQVGPDLKWMRDATRGGVATVLNELSRDTQLVVELTEESIPVADVVRGACELLGLDPLHVANEGQFVAIVSSDRADEAIEALRRVPGGEQARLIGAMCEGRVARVVAKASYGGVRIVDMLIGDPLPRIC
jgi:hydrogenase expression/formation protein HypE